MITITPIELQPIQQAIEPTPVVDKIDAIGYSRRAIDQRSQVRNVYLDSATINGSATIATVSLADLDNATVTVNSGNLWWSVVNSGSPTVSKIYIPAQWTYIIQWSVFISSAPWVWLFNIFLQKNGIEWIDVFASMIQHWETIAINKTLNLSKWDYINIYFDNESDDSAEVSIQVTLTKIS
jgi:hypothetical protein